MFGVAYWYSYNTHYLEISSLIATQLSRYGSFLFVNCEIEAGDILIVSYISERR